MFRVLEMLTMLVPSWDLQNFGSSQFTDLFISCVVMAVLGLMFLSVALACISWCDFRLEHGKPPMLEIAVPESPTPQSSGHHYKEPSVQTEIPILIQATLPTTFPTLQNLKEGASAQLDPVGAAQDNIPILDMVTVPMNAPVLLPIVVPREFSLLESATDETGPDVIESSTAQPDSTLANPVKRAPVTQYLSPGPDKSPHILDFSEVHTNWERTPMAPEVLDRRTAIDPSLRKSGTKSTHRGGRKTKELVNSDWAWKNAFKDVISRMEKGEEVSLQYLQDREISTQMEIDRYRQTLRDGAERKRINEVNGITANAEAATTTVVGQAATETTSESETAGNKPASAGFEALGNTMSGVPSTTPASIQPASAPKPGSSRSARRRAASRKAPRK